MKLFQLSIQKDSQTMRLYLSFAAVIAIIPLALNTKAPAPTPPPKLPIIKPASYTATPQTPATINLRLSAAHDSSLIGGSFQAEPDTAQDTPDNQDETQSVWQNSQATAVEAAPPAIVTPPASATPVDETPVGGRGGGETSPTPPPATPPTTPDTPTPNPSPLPNPVTTASTGSGTPRREGNTQPPRPQRVRTPSPLRRLL